MNTHRLTYVVFLLLVFLCKPLALADARSLGMAGVVVPGPGGIGKNPAFAALPQSQERLSISLPLGGLNAFRESLNPFSNKFDILATADQLSHLDSFIFNLPKRPEDLEFIVDDRGLTLDFIGGANLNFTKRLSINQQVAFPITFKFPGQNRQALQNLSTRQANLSALLLSIRPYTLVQGNIEDLGGLTEALSGIGSNQAAVEIKTIAEAGVAFEVVYANQVSLNERSHDLYLGLRGAGTLGLLRADGDVMANARINQGASPLGPSVGYSYDGTGFISTITAGQFGIGVQGDFGLVVVTPSINVASLPTETLSFGLAIRNLGLNIWRGTEYQLQGDQTGDAPRRPKDAWRTRAASSLALNLSLAYEQKATKAAPAVLVAADTELRRGRLSFHTGAELDFGITALRAGLGADDGFVFGLGAGFDLQETSLDLALSSHTSPYTRHRAYGLAASFSLPF